MVIYFGEFVYVGGAMRHSDAPFDLWNFALSLLGEHAADEIKLFIP